MRTLNITYNEKAELSPDVQEILDKYYSKINELEKSRELILLRKMICCSASESSIIVRDLETVNRQIFECERYMHAIHKGDY